MDIRVHTGKIFHQIPTEIAALLIEAFPASFERVERPTPPANITARWLNGENPYSGRATIVCDCVPCHRVNTYDLKPDPDLFEQSFNQFLCVHGRGKCPPEVFERYKFIWKPKRDPISGAEI
jgi:hypothetical protein